MLHPDIDALINSRNVFAVKLALSYRKRLPSELTGERREGQQRNEGSPLGVRAE
jgi:hypothetical protein